MAKARVGRPQMYTPIQIAEIAQDLEDYIERSPDPILVGFTSSYTKYHVNKDYINDHEEFSDLRKKSVEKQEAYLLYGATRAVLNPAMSIFRLKQPQHGYKDRIDQDVTSGGKPVPILGGISVRTDNSATQTSESQE